MAAGAPLVSAAWRARKAEVALIDRNSLPATPLVGPYSTSHVCGRRFFRAANRGVIWDDRRARIQGRASLVGCRTCISRVR